MISSGILTLLGLGVFAVAFAVISGWRGRATALVSLCWVPLVSLILAVAAFQRLGYTFFGLLIVIMVLSLALALLGAILIIRARREGSGSIRALTITTMVAAAPFVMALGAWVILTIRGH